MDALNALAEIIVGLHRTKVFGSWFRLCFGMAFTYWTTLSSVTGLALTVGKASYPIAIGSGLISASGACVFLFQLSPLTKNIMVALPHDSQPDLSQFQSYEKTK